MVSANRRKYGVRREATVATPAPVRTYSRMPTRRPPAPSAARVGGVPSDEVGDSGADVRRATAVGVSHGASDQRCDVLHVTLGHALRRHRGGADPDAGCDGRWLRIERD